MRAYNSTFATVLLEVGALVALQSVGVPLNFGLYVAIVCFGLVGGMAVGALIEIAEQLTRVGR